MIKTRIFSRISRNISILNHHAPKSTFETVYALPQIKYIALINRLKVYHLFGSGVTIPTCGVLELLNVIPNNTFFTVSYIGITGAAVMTLASIPLRNIIGFLYISDDNKLIKISSVDFWGKRKDKIIDANDWIPLLEMSPKIRDAIYLTPKLTDGTEYKLIIKFGKVLNAQKIGQVLE